MEVEQTTAGAAQRFSRDLAELHARVGRPSYSTLERLSDRRLKRATIGEILSGKRRRAPGWPFVSAFVEACRAAAQKDGLDTSGLGSLADWKRQWDAVSHGPWDEEAFRSGRPTMAASTSGLGRSSRAWSGGATRTLPRDIATFTGREHELSRLMKAVAGSAGSDGMVRIQAIGGMAGVGKTALAVHAAHLLAGSFPDGQIFLGLHGHTPGLRPVDPGDALSTLLRTTGLPPERIPSSLDERAALWRDLLAGKQVLLVLDDATSSSQVQSLLPSSPGSLVLVTSRRRLSALEDAQAINLDILPPDDAATLLVRLADRPGLGADDRAVREIVQMCGCLPLAVGMMGRHLRHHPAWTSKRLAAALASARDRLELLTAEEVKVTAALDMSYERLTESQRQSFRRIGLHPGADFDVYSVAALDDADMASAGRCLDVLYDQNFLSEPVPGRYRMHDLVRQYARVLAARDSAGESDSAVERLRDYYLRAAMRADLHLTRRSRPGSSSACVTDAAQVLPDFENREQALSWARTERANLLACLDTATRDGLDAFVVSLTAAMASLHQHDGPWESAIHRHIAAVQAARHLGDRLGEANALNDLGIVRRLVGDYADASQVLESALRIYRDLDERLGNARTLTSLGGVRQRTGDYGAAAAALETALTIYRGLSYRLGEAAALTSLGGVRQRTGDYGAAAAALETALTIYRDLGDRGGEAEVLNETGNLHRNRSDVMRAETYYRKALELARSIASRWDEANALAGLGNCALKTGRTVDARKALRNARAILQELDAAEAASLDIEIRDLMDT